MINFAKMIEPMAKKESRIFTIRGVEVILDRDLAEFYSVPTSRLNEQAKRNLSGYWCERGV